MKIHKLVLKGYKRLQLRQIKEFVFEPRQPIQVIIGTNGSGKSSIALELSPLPADSKHYSENGSKEILITQNGITYEIGSFFPEGKKDYHSFKKNGEELNESGLITDQNRLVLQEFRLTPEIHKFALGKVSFTESKPPQRKDWIMKFADANYDYAIEYYNRLKQRANDLGSAVRANKKRLVTETAKILPMQELDALRKETNELHELLAVLMEDRKPVDYPLEQDLDKTFRIKGQLSAFVTNVTKRLKILRSFGYLDKNEVLREISNLTATAKACEILSTEYFKDFEKINEVYELLEKTHTHNIFTIDAKLRKLIQEQNTLLSSRSYDYSLQKDPKHAQEALQGVIERLDQLLPTLPPNPDKVFSRASLEVLESQKADLTEKLAIGSRSIEDKKGILEHYKLLKDQETTECPNCKHKWIRGYDEHKVKAITAALEAEMATALVLNEQLKTVTKKIEELHEYFRIYREYISLTKNWPILDPLWDHITSLDLVINSPMQVTQIANNYKRDLITETQILEIEKEIDELKQNVSMSEKTLGMDFEKTKQRKEELEENIRLNQQNQSKAQSEITRLNNWVSNVTTVESIYTSLENLIKEFESAENHALETIRRETYNDLIRAVQSGLARKENVLRESETQLRIIEDIQKSITDMENQEKLLKLAVKELSPTEGIIAEGLFGFMKLFIKQMNDMVKRIWTYPLTVLPCAVEEGQKLDLSYKFPFTFDTIADPVDDVNMASTAMKEVIDLAFRINGLKAMHFNEFPLYLDEFGHSMDPTHKAATIHLVNSIMEQEAFTQLFMISHDMLQYGALANTDVLVLCDQNVVIPNNCVYNQHVRMS